jgi:hypothetical protein
LVEFIRKVSPRRLVAIGFPQIADQLAHVGELGERHHAGDD